MLRFARCLGHRALVAETVLETVGPTMRFGGAVAVNHVDFALMAEPIGTVLRCASMPQSSRAHG